MPKRYVLRCERNWVLESESDKEEDWLVVYVKFSWIFCILTPPPPVTHASLRTCLSLKPKLSARANLKPYWRLYFLSENKVKSLIKLPYCIKIGKFTKWSVFKFSLTRNEFTLGFNYFQTKAHTKTNKTASLFRENDVYNHRVYNRIRYRNVTRNIQRHHSNSYGGCILVYIPE